MSSLSSAFDDWDWLLANPRYARSQSRVAWEGFAHQMLPFRVMAEHIAELSENGQYSFQVADGSLFQLIYQFDATGNVLNYGSLAFYKTLDEPLPSPENEAEEIGDDGASGISELDDQPGTLVDQTRVIETIPWIRLDYDPNAANGALHAASHLHASIADSVRIAVAGVPSPKQFVEAVLSWFYPDEYRQRHLLEGGQFSDPGRQADVNEMVAAIVAEPHVLGAVHLLIPPYASRVPP